jgi:hypothetical protein
MRGVILFAAGLGLAASAQAKSAWSLNEADGRTVLFYGVQDSPEEVDIMFVCKGGGAVEATLPRSSEKVKSGTDVSFTMTIGKTKAQFHGAASDNHLDGIPSATAMAGIRNPVFQALAGKGVLVIEVAGTKYTAPLSGMGKKAKAFLDTCKPTM